MTGKEKFVHRNLLLPVNFLILDEDETPSSLMESYLGVAVDKSSQGLVAYR